MEWKQSGGGLQAHLSLRPDNFRHGKVAANGPESRRV
jgi:hypothetical protein